MAGEDIYTQELVNLAADALRAAAANPSTAATVRALVLASAKGLVQIAASLMQFLKAQAAASSQAALPAEGPLLIKDQVGPWLVPSVHDRQLEE